MANLTSRRALTVAIAATVAAVFVGFAAAGTVRGVEPSLLSGNPKCTDVPNLSFTTQVSFDSPVNGASASGVHVTIDGTRVGWFTLGDILVKAVIVKGGTAANVYRYTSGQDYSDGGLFPPLNPKTGNLYSLGSLRFCY